MNELGIIFNLKDKYIFYRDYCYIKGHRVGYEEIIAIANKSIRHSSTLATRYTCSFYVFTANKQYKISHTTFYIKTNKFKLTQEILAFLLKVTHGNRSRQYTNKLDSQGFFEVDKAKFNIDGTIELNGKKFSVIDLIESKSLEIGDNTFFSSPRNFNPNIITLKNPAYFFKSTLDISLNRDVVLDIIKGIYIYNKRFPDKCKKEKPCRLCRKSISADVMRCPFCGTMQ